MLDYGCLESEPQSMWCKIGSEFMHRVRTHSESWWEQKMREEDQIHGWLHIVSLLAVHIVEINVFFEEQIKCI